MSVQMDFVSAWKASSIVLTGAFGILGLATEFRNKHTKKITRWGYFSLLGIVISTACGTAAQIIESSDDAAKALKVSITTATMLSGVERLLTPSGIPTVRLVMGAPCSDAVYRQFCSTPLIYPLSGDGAQDSTYAWMIWPGVKGGRVYAEMKIGFFRDEKRARACFNDYAKCNLSNASDIFGSVLGENYGQNYNLFAQAPDWNSHQMLVEVADKLSLSDYRSDGTMVSTKDFDRSMAVIVVRGSLLKLNLRLEKMQIFFPNGQEAESSLPIAQVFSPHSGIVDLVPLTLP